MHFWIFKSTPFYATCNESKHIYVCTWLYAFSSTPNPFLRTCGRSKEFQTLSRYQSGYSNTSAQVKKRLCRLIKIYPRMAITPRPLAPAEDWQRISVPPDTKHNSLKRLLWYYYHWTKLPCDIFWMTSIERYQCEDLIALHQSINIFRMIWNVPFQHYCSANVAVPPLPSFWSWPTRPCWLENQHLTAHSPSTLLAQCLTKPGKLGGDALARDPSGITYFSNILLLPKVLEVFWKGHSISFIEHIPRKLQQFLWN